MAGGSYQEGLTVHLQGVPPGLLITDEQIYEDLLIRKPTGSHQPRREPDIPIIFSGVNAATPAGLHQRRAYNGTPFRS